MLRTVAVVATLLAVALFPITARATVYADISFSGNVTGLSDSEMASYDFREVSFFSFDVLGEVAGFYSEAAEVKGTGTSTSGSATIDLVVGGFLAALDTYPLSFAYYFDDATSWTGSTGADLLETLKAKSSASGGLGAIAYLTIEEIDASGNVAATLELDSVFGGLSGLQIGSSSSYLQDSSGNLRYNWVAQTHGGAVYNFSYVHSQVLGQLTLGADLTPKSTDVILQISGYTYANDANHLRLTYAAGWGVFNWQGSSTFTSQYITTGNNPNSFYLYNSDKVSVSGNLQGGVNVQVQSQTQAELETANGAASALITDLTEGLTNGATGYAIVTIDFLAGATDIAYDPAAGFEPPGGAGNTVRASFLAILFAALGAVLFQQL